MQQIVKYAFYISKYAKPNIYIYRIVLLLKLFIIIHNLLLLH